MPFPTILCAGKWLISSPLNSIFPFDGGNTPTIVRNKRCLAGSVSTQQCDKISLGNLQRYIMNDLMLANHRGYVC